VRERVTLPKRRFEMTKSEVSPAPQKVTPYLCCKGALKAIDFYTRAFGATVREKVLQPDGRVGHAELTIEDAAIMLADEFPDLNFRGTTADAPTSMMVHLVVRDVDAFAQRAAEAGATVLQPADSEPGHRRCKLRDPWGHSWLIESPDERGVRATEPGRAELLALWERLDLMTPMAMRTLATLRIPDRIAEGHASLADLASHANVDQDALGRMLRYLAVRGIIDEPSPGCFALNRVSALLLDEHPSATRRWIDLEGFGGTMDRGAFDLLHTIRHGGPPNAGHKAELTSEVAASYDSVMEAQSRYQTPAIAAAFDWGSAKHVVDVGGGTGTLLAGLLGLHQHLCGTLVELPATAERARDAISEAGLSARCNVIAGDLFDVMPRGSDVYVFKFVLHAMDDDVAAAALALSREAAEPQGRILVIERTLMGDDDRALFTAMDMIMLTLGHGRERTLEEYKALAVRAGLRLCEAMATPLGFHVMELRTA
jgi:uncharacterized glyoxalase superfamily protein PhnB